MILKSNYRLLLLCRKGMFIRGGTTLQVNKLMALGFQDCPKFKAAQNSTVPLSKEDTTTPTSNSKAKAKAKCTATPKATPKATAKTNPKTSGRGGGRGRGRGK